MAPDAATMPDRRSLYEQVGDLWRFARRQKMYDAQDWLCGFAAGQSSASQADRDHGSARPVQWVATPTTGR